jgi:hypothetical protein
MNWKSFWSRACPAYFCLLAAAAPFHPRINQDHPNSLAARSRQVTELDENAIRKLVGIPGGRARPLLLYLWYTACQPCCAKLADVDKIYAEYHDRGLDVALVSISPMDNKDSLSAYLEDHSVRAPAYLLNELDDELAEQIFLKEWEVIVPSAFFYSRSGGVVAAETDAKAIEYSTLKRRAERLLSTEAQPAHAPERKESMAPSEASGWSVGNIWLAPGSMTSLAPGILPARTLPFSGGTS